MSITHINNALETRLSTLANLPPVAWPNTDFEPTVGTLHLRVTNLFGANESATLDYLEHQQGIFQISIFAPTGAGRGDADALQDQIIEHFFANRTLTNNGTTVRIRSLDASPAEVDGTWYVASISVNYSVHLQR